MLQESLAKQLGAAAVRVVAVDEVSGAERDQALAEAEAAFGDYAMRERLDKSLLEKMPRLKFWQQPMVGYNNIDLAACSAHDLLPLADIVSLHVPLMEQTRGLIGIRELDMMKSQAVLINVSRGELADERAIADRLRTKKLCGAGIDVFPQEPISPDDPLLALDNAILTPHIAGATNEARAP